MQKRFRRLWCEYWLIFQIQSFDEVLSQIFMGFFKYTFRVYWHLYHRFCVISLPAICSCILGCNVTHDPIAKSMLKYWLNIWINIFRYFYQSFDFLLLISIKKYLQCPYSTCVGTCNWVIPYGLKDTIQFCFDCNVLFWEKNRASDKWCDYFNFCR